MHIRSGWTQFERFIRFDAGNGTQTRFWLDVWQGKTAFRRDIPLCFTLQEIEMLEWPIMQKSGMMSVIGPQCFCVVHDWEVDLVEQMLEDLYITKVQNGNTDKLVWTP